MKENYLVNNQWYWIEYKRKLRGYVGPGKYIEYNKKDTTKKSFKGTDLFYFYIPKYANKFLYALDDVKHTCKQIPEYDELLDMCGLKMEDFKNVD